MSKAFKKMSKAFKKKKGSFSQIKESMAGRREAMQRAIMAFGGLPAGMAAPEAPKETAAGSEGNPGSPAAIAAGDQGAAPEAGGRLEGASSSGEGDGGSGDAASADVAASPSPSGPQAQGGACPGDAPSSESRGACPAEPVQDKGTAIPPGPIQLCEKERRLRQASVSAFHAIQKLYCDQDDGIGWESCDGSPVLADFERALREADCRDDLWKGIFTLMARIQPIVVGKLDQRHADKLRERYEAVRARNGETLGFMGASLPDFDQVSMVRMDELSLEALDGKLAKVGEAREDFARRIGEKPENSQKGFDRYVSDLSGLRSALEESVKDCSGRLAAIPLKVADAPLWRLRRLEMEECPFAQVMGGCGGEKRPEADAPRSPTSLKSIVKAKNAMERLGSELHATTDLNRDLLEKCRALENENRSLKERLEAVSGPGAGSGTATVAAMATMAATGTASAAGTSEAGPAVPSNESDKEASLGDEERERHRRIHEKLEGGLSAAEIEALIDDELSLIRMERDAANTRADELERENGVLRETKTSLEADSDNLRIRLNEARHEANYGCQDGVTLERLGSMEIPKSPVEVAEFFRSMFPQRIAFTEEALRSLRESQSPSSNVKSKWLWKALMAMVGPLHDILSEGGPDMEKRFNEDPRAAGFELTLKEGKLTRRDPKLMALRKRKWMAEDNVLVDIDIEPHVKRGGNENAVDFVRIYYCWVPEYRRIVVGHLPTHLPNASTKNPRKKR